MKNIKYSILIIICFLIYASHLSAQETEEKTLIKVTPERSAEGQTKWMISKLRLDPSMYKTLYDINLKYHLKSDSVHLLSIALTVKKESYLQYSQTRDEELEKALTPDQFKEYQEILESIKAEARLVRQ